MLLFDMLVQAYSARRAERAAEAHAHELHTNEIKRQREHEQASVQFCCCPFAPRTMMIAMTALARKVSVVISVVLCCVCFR
eukprot:SAG31_NODE_7118_length_1784_cov_1.503858_3_plen_81_part_00